MSSRVLMPIVAVAAIAGCGGDDDSQKAASPAPKGGPPPAELQGTYSVRLKPSDLPPAKDAPPEFKPENKPYAWRVEIADTGGPENGPTLSIVNVALGPLESPKLTVSGDQLRLSGEECPKPSGETFVDTTYRWALSGDALTLTKLDGGCSDKVAETILTTKPLTKVP